MALYPAERAFIRCLARCTEFVLLVGGSVRDSVLGIQPVDLDISTSASTELVGRVAVRCDSVRSTYSLGERFGTVGVVLNSGRLLEVTTAQGTASAATDQRFAEDAAHRDFTVNAIAFDPIASTVLDPTGGLRDLATRTLRAPGDPGERFAEDPLRVLRAARFVSELGFELEPGTRAALSAHAGRLSGVAVERVREELTRLLIGDAPDRGLEIALECGALEAVLPEVAAMAGVSQPSFHDLDVFRHTAQAVALSPNSSVMRWAALLHDVGKPAVRSVDANGRIRFFRHAQEGAKSAAEICERLRFSRDDTAAVVHLVAQHMRLEDINAENPASVDRAVRKLDLWVGACDGARLLVSAEDALELTMADFSATAHRHEASQVRAVLQTALADSRVRGSRRMLALPISGTDVMRELGLGEGPAIGRALRAVTDAIERGVLDEADRQGALSIAEKSVAPEPSADPGDTPRSDSSV